MCMWYALEGANWRGEKLFIGPSFKCQDMLEVYWSRPFTRTLTSVPYLSPSPSIEASSSASVTQIMAKPAEESPMSR
jgi:hypothetical protein